MIRSLLVVSLLIGASSAQYVQQQRAGAVQQQPVQNVQAAQPDAIDQIPAWYQMAKPVASRTQQLPQASPSYYERIEPTYEQRRGEQPTYERPGIQTNQYANYPSYSNRQPYENLNALTSGASLSNLQASRRYPSGAAGGSGGNDMPYDSALKRYHKLLLKRRQWTTKIGRILASTTPMTPSSTAPTSTTTTTTTTTQAPTTTTKKMPKSLKSIYSTIIPKTTTTTEKPTEATTSGRLTTIINGRIVGKPRGTFKPHGTRKGWRMWKKVTPKYVGKPSTTTTVDPITSTTTPTEPSTTVSSTSTTVTTTSTPELPLIEEEEEEVTETVASTSTTTESTSTTTPETTTTATEEPTTTTTTTTKGSEGKVPSSLRYICRHKAGSNEHDPFSERRASTIGPFRPISVGHKWKPLRFKKPEPVDEVATVPATSNKTTSIYTGPKGLRLLEYLLKQTDTFAKGLQKAIDGPNTELLAAIKDVVAKFKASLDEAGIDQDVRLMGNQLKNTWQQLRTGLDRGMKAVRHSAESSVTQFNYGPQPQPVVPQQPVQIPYHHQHLHHPTSAMHRYPPGPMNEQIGRLFEKAVADAADQKQQQQLQQVQQQLAASRP